jgi:acyl carrier protein
VTDDHVEDRVRLTLARSLEAVPADRERDLVDEGLLDSLALVELLVGLEQEFQIRFAPEQLEIARFRSIAALVDLVREGVGMQP